MKKPSKAELIIVVQELVHQSGQTHVALSWIVDLLISKGVFTGEEMKAFFDQKKAAAEANMLSQNPPPEPSCPADTSSPSSTPSTTPPTT